jgi:hypothetical protein
MANEVTGKRWFKVAHTGTYFIKAVDAEEAKELCFEDADSEDWVTKVEEYDGPLPFCQCEAGK